MPSSKCRLPLQFGQFSRLPPERIKILTICAEELAAAYKSDDESAWINIINEANRRFTKYESGIVSGIVLSLVRP